jgi:hypothetical protein
VRRARTPRRCAAIVGARAETTQVAHALAEVRPCGQSYAGICCALPRSWAVVAKTSRHDLAHPERPPSCNSSCPGTV